MVTGATVSAGATELPETRKKSARCALMLRLGLMDKNTTLSILVLIVVFQRIHHKNIFCRHTVGIRIPIVVAN